MRGRQSEKQKVKTEKKQTLGSKEKWKEKKIDCV